jgi:hypothetical protein
MDSQTGCKCGGSAVFDKTSMSWICRACGNHVCPACGQSVRYVLTVDGWFCDQCSKFAEPEERRPTFIRPGVFREGLADQYKAKRPTAPPTGTLALTSSNLVFTGLGSDLQVEIPLRAIRDVRTFIIPEVLKRMKPGVTGAQSVAHALLASPLFGTAIGDTVVGSLRENEGGIEIKFLGNDGSSSAARFRVTDAESWVSHIRASLRQEHASPTTSGAAPPAGKFCINCGVPLPSHAIFCNKCGSKQ